ncbi:hypothetical protein WMY93_025693 [Mugilogobius chulae]|uniref:Uncharacterized protein n=1 Tax=Mugilogobius chulae TaxID=88201 RepID=A0AAW0N229_9GOBI
MAQDSSFITNFHYQAFHRLNRLTDPSGGLSRSLTELQIPQVDCPGASQSYRSLRWTVPEPHRTTDPSGGLSRSLIELQIPQQVCRHRKWWSLTELQLSHVDRFGASLSDGCLRWTAPEPHTKIADD